MLLTLLLVTSASLVVGVLLLLKLTATFVLKVATGLATAQVQKFKGMATGFISLVAAAELFSVTTELIVHILTAAVISALQLITLTT